MNQITVFEKQQTAREEVERNINGNGDVENELVRKAEENGREYRAEHGLPSGVHLPEEERIRSYASASEGLEMHCAVGLYNQGGIYSFEGFHRQADSPSFIPQVRFDNVSDLVDGVKISVDRLQEKFYGTNINVLLYTVTEQPEVKEEDMPPVRDAAARLEIPEFTEMTAKLTPQDLQRRGLTPKERAEFEKLYNR